MALNSSNATENVIRQAEIKKEQEEFAGAYTVSELRKIQKDYDASVQNKELSLEEINQYINEVRKGEE